MRERRVPGRRWRGMKERGREGERGGRRKGVRDVDAT